MECHPVRTNSKKSEEFTLGGHDGYCISNVYGGE
jgi:hypothetical protein